MNHRTRCRPAAFSRVETLAITSPLNSKLTGTSWITTSGMALPVSWSFS